METRAGTCTAPPCGALRTYSSSSHVRGTRHESSTGRRIATHKKKSYTYTRTPGKRTHVQTYINTYYPYTHIHTYICTLQTQQTENQLYHQLRAVLQSPDYCLSNGQERIRIGINICKGERRHFARTSEIQGAQVVGENWGFLLTSITYSLQFYARALVSETERG